MKLGISAAVSCVIMAGCGARQAPAPAREPAPAAPAPAPASAPAAAPPVIELDAVRIEVVTNARGEREVVAFDARDIFDAGTEALLAGDYDTALGRYEELVADFPGSALVVPALYNAGLAHEGKAEWDLAIARYRDIVARGEAGRDTIDAAIRMGAVMAELERWPDAIETFESLLARDDLTPTDRVEALGRLGYVLLESKDHPGAEEVLRQALGYYEEISATAPLETDYFVAMARYYLAQIPHREFYAIPIRLPDKQIARDMEAKADRVLIAHDRYLATVEVGNPYWATAAGYQLASMQKQFWDALVTAPIPPFPTIAEEYQAETAAVYVQEVHEQTRQFLDKALATHRKNIEWADSRGVSTVWVEASRREARKVADILARESAGDLVIPGEAELTALELAPIPPAAGGYVPGRVDL